jgi:hypothetical protein
MMYLTNTNKFKGNIKCNGDNTTEECDKREEVEYSDNKKILFVVQIPMSVECSLLHNH